MASRFRLSAPLAGALALALAPLGVTAQTEAEKFEWGRREAEKRHFENIAGNWEKDHPSRPVEYPAEGRLGRFDQPTKLTKAQKKLVAPDPADEAAFAAFLKMPDTGIVRLFPYSLAKNSGGYVVSAKGGERSGIWGEGGYYSFARQTHVSRQWSEILFSGDALASDVSRNAIGMLVDLGDVPIESLQTTSPGVAALDEFRPSLEYGSARATASSLEQGVKRGEYLYKSSLPIAAGRTYGLRSVLYGRNDALYALRVVRAAPDGSITLLWRQIREYDAPKLKVEKPAAKATAKDTAKPAAQNKP